MHGLWHLNEHNIWANCGFLFQNVVYTLIWCCIWHWNPNKQVLRGCISKIFKILYSARTCHIELHGHVTVNNLHGRGGTDTTDVPRTFYHALALSIVQYVLLALLTFNPSITTPSLSRRFNLISGSLSCVSSFTSIFSTLTIGYLIYSSTRHDKRSRRRYTHIIEILIQSSAFYSFTTTAVAVCAFGTTNDIVENGRTFIADNYFSTLQLFSIVSNL